MNKQTFLVELSRELKKNGVTESGEILDEYVQHFEFKQADGFTEEEICAELGAPAVLAGQFREAETTADRRGGRIVAALGVGFMDLWAGIALLLLTGWGVVMCAFAVACAVAGACLLGGFTMGGLLPPMPYWCGAVFGVSLAALAVLTGCGAVYFGAFLRQSGRAYGRLRQNFRAAAQGTGKLPPLSAAPRLASPQRRRLRRLALLALTVFAISAMLGMLVSMLSAGAMGFWHAWGWFGHNL